MHKEDVLYKTLHEGDYINSTMLVFGKESSSKYTLETKVTLYEVDIDVFNNIPIIFSIIYSPKMH